jgi:GNAT superfamily N-acetyltransferase
MFTLRKVTQTALSVLHAAERKGAVSMKATTGSYMLFTYWLKYQGKGIGKSLFKAVLQHLHENRLTSMVVLVLEDNEACKFYESMGGKKIGRLKDMIGGKTVYELIFGWEKI